MGIKRHNRERGIGLAPGDAIRQMRDNGVTPTSQAATSTYDLNTATNRKRISAGISKDQWDRWEGPHAEERGTNLSVNHLLASDGLTEPERETVLTAAHRHQSSRDTVRWMKAVVVRMRPRRLTVEQVAVVIRETRTDAIAEHCAALIECGDTFDG